MSARKTIVPAIPSIGKSEKEVSATLAALKEATEVGLGRRGDKLDRFVTVRDLELAGIASANSSGDFRGTSGGGGGQDFGDIDGGGDGLPYNGPPNYGQEDYTPPPMPTNVRMQPIAPSSFMVIFDPPNYGNHAYAEIFLMPGNGSTQTLQTMLAASPGFNQTKPCTGASDGVNPCPFFRGRYGGSNATIPVAAGDGAGGSIGTTNALGAALNPPPVYAWVRFVSLAKVAGIFGPQGTGAMGRPSIDPVLVLDLMTASVTASPLYANLTNFIGDDQEALDALRARGGITHMYDDMSSMWTVQMGLPLNPEDPGDGYVAAGFGLGLDVNDDGTTSSLFAVNADKFALMGSGTPFVRIESVSGTTTQKRITLPNGVGNNKFRMGSKIVFKPTGSVVLDANQLAQAKQWEGVEAVIVGDGTTTPPVNGELIPGRVLDVQRAVPAEATSTNFPSATAILTSIRFFVTGVTNIPFIVDTVNNVVGIRGSLIVDGLVRATTGDFDTLTASTAFIGSLRAGVVNANMVCAQAIIAGNGIPDAQVVGGAITDTNLNALNQWIVKLSTPEPGGYPFRIYNPARAGANTQNEFNLLTMYGGDPLSLVPEVRDPYLYVNGNFKLGGNATFNLVQGGAVAFGVKSGAGANAGTAYTAWFGADSDYAKSQTQMDEKGFFWVRKKFNPEPGWNDTDPAKRIKAGMNLDLFLGENALALPVMAANAQPGAAIIQGNGGPRAGSTVITSESTSSLQVRGLRNGGTAVTMVTANGYLASINDGSASNFKRFKFKVELREINTGAIIPVQEIEMDDYGPEAWDYNLMGVVSAPPGTYRVKLVLTNMEQRPMSIIQGWNAMAMQVAASGALA